MDAVIPGVAFGLFFAVLEALLVGLLLLFTALEALFLIHYLRPIPLLTLSRLLFNLRSRRMMLCSGSAMFGGLSVWFLPFRWTIPFSHFLYRKLFALSSVPLFIAHLVRTLSHTKCFAISRLRLFAIYGMFSTALFLLDSSLPLGNMALFWLFPSRGNRLFFLRIVGQFNSFLLWERPLNGLSIAVFSPSLFAITFP